MLLKKQLVKLLYRIPNKLIDIPLLIALKIVSPIIYFYAIFRASSVPRSRDFLIKKGIYILREDFYQPFFNFKNLKKHTRNLSSIDFCQKEQLKFLSTLNYQDELINLNLNKRMENKFDFSFSLEDLKIVEYQSGGFEEGDAEILYQVVRRFKPKNIIEAGYGNSTKIMLKAISQNMNEGHNTNLLCIDPYPREYLKKEGFHFIQKKIEEVDLDIYGRLEENDFLFIDTSHMIKPQGDVLTIFLEILPKLKPGVIVHIHDIYSPNDYPIDLLKKEIIFFNEQYLLEALLLDSKRYETLAGLNYLFNSHLNELCNVCPYLAEGIKLGTITNERAPRSYYLRIKK